MLLSEQDAPSDPRFDTRYFQEEFLTGNPCCPNDGEIREKKDPEKSKCKAKESQRQRRSRTQPRGAAGAPTGRRGRA